MIGQNQMLHLNSFSNEAGEDAYVRHSNGGAGSISLLFHGAYIEVHYLTLYI